VTIQSGTPIGKYVVRRKLAEGGMAEIYLAYARGPEGFEKEVVIKRIRSFLATDPSFVDMFIAEARLASRLNHANLVQIFDFDKHEDSYYLAMEYVRGHSLYDVRRRARETLQSMKPALVAHVGAEVARGLHHAHRLTDKGKPLNLVHRDVTPHNVLLSYDGAVKLTDFGVAKAGNSHTAAGVLKGKFAYMSPEQSRGDPVDARTDVFALGIVLWEMLTGGRLFDGDSDVAVLRAVQQSAIAPPARLNPDVSAELDAIIMRALEREASARFQTAGELERALASFVLQTSKSIDDTDLGAYLRALYAEEVLAPGEMTMTRTPVAPPPPPQPHQTEPTGALRPRATEGGSGSPVVEVDPGMLTGAGSSLSPDEDAHGATYVKPGLSTQKHSPAGPRKGPVASGAGEALTTSPATTGGATTASGSTAPEKKSSGPVLNPATTVPDAAVAATTAPMAALTAAPTEVPSPTPKSVRGGSPIALLVGGVLLVVAVGASSYALRGKLGPSAEAPPPDGPPSTKGASLSPVSAPRAEPPPSIQPTPGSVPGGGHPLAGDPAPSPGNPLPPAQSAKLPEAQAMTGTPPSPTKPPEDPKPSQPLSSTSGAPGAEKSSGPAGVTPSPGGPVTPASAAANKGTLVLQVIPYGLVMIDGKAHGENDRVKTYPLPAGHHKIVVRGPTGDGEKAKVEAFEIDVVAGKRISHTSNFFK